MITTEANKIDSVDSIYEDFKNKSMAGNELFERLSAITTSAPLKNMSILKFIADEARFIDNAQTSTIQFQRLLQKCKEEYLRYLDLEDSYIEEISFFAYIKLIIKNHKAPAREYAEIENKEKFWSFIRQIEGWLNKR